MKLILRNLGFVFVLLTFAGAGYVLYTGGTASPGFAVIPMLFGMICFSGYRRKKQQEDEEK